MKFLRTFLILTLITEASGAASRNCFSQHLLEAIHLNQHRKPLYSQASAGKSRDISNALIALEYSMYVPTRLVDVSAAKYQAQGIPLICREIPSMKTAPSIEKLDLPLLSRPQASDFKDLDVFEIRRHLRASLDEGYENLARTTQETIDSLPELRLNCLARHFLESIRAFASEAPHHLALAKPSERKSLRSFLNFIIRGQIDYIFQAHEIDQMAVEVQAAGIPILCQDVPHIPIPKH